MTRIHTIVIIASVALVTFDAQAADQPAPLPVKAQASAPAYRWTGLYFGGHFGYGGGGFGPGTNPAHNEAVVFPSSVTGLIGGYQVGYNWQLPNNVVLGVEGDITFLSPLDVNATATAPFNTTLNYVATARGRAGYAFGNFVPYVTGGLAVGQSKVEALDGDGAVLSPKQHTHVGWTAGVGVEVALDRHWSAKLEYNYIDLGAQTYSLDQGPLNVIAVDPKLHIAKLGLNYKIDNTASRSEPTFPAMTVPDAPKSENWNVHAQTTFILQGYPGFRSPYQGANSLPGGGQTRETWTNTAFLGWRLWDGGELYFNPELAQGFGLNSTLGLAGFSNGEAQKAGFPYPHYNTSRAFLRQTWGLGGEQENIESDTVHMGGKTDVSRVSVTVGRIFLPDFVGNNAYADEPRTTFLNWSIWAAGAFDFPADQLGYSWGALVEFNQKNWAIRAGYLLMPSESNSNYFDMNIPKRGEYLVELENRYTLFGRPGKLRTIGWVNSAFTGSFSDTLANPALNLDISQTRQGRLKWGYVFNVEQSVTDDVELFGRWSWNDGKTETMAFTDINASLSGGLSIKGKSWGRPEDTVGIAGAVNSISSNFQAFVAAGGTGVLIGDGQLNYHTEDILETYYAISLYKESTLTFDYQLIANPAYNADRGPVSFYSLRYHAEW